MRDEWACCCDEAANHQLPKAEAIFLELHLSADKEHWGCTSYELFGLEEHTHEGQHLPNQNHS